MDTKQLRLFNQLYRTQVSLLVYDRFDILFNILLNTFEILRPKNYYGTSYFEKITLHSK